MKELKTDNWHKGKKAYWIPGPGSSPGCQEGHRGEESLIYSRVGVTGIIILLWVAGRIIKFAENISSKMIRLIPFQH